MWEWTSMDEVSAERIAFESIRLTVLPSTVHRPMAKQLVALLAPLRPLFLEEPLLASHVSELASLAKMSSAPIALGERLYTRNDFRPYFEQGAVDVIQPDVAHAGGISETMRIARMGETYDVAFCPHCPNG